MSEVSRRDLLLAGAGVGGLALLGAPALATGTSTSQRGRPRVVIIGAGLAGLSCANVLQRKGVRARVFEARPDRVGGRCWSSRGWKDGQIAEHGGEFIDTRHSRMQALARRYRLTLDDSFDNGGGKPRLFLQGKRRHRWQFDDDMREFNRRIVALAQRIGPYDTAHASRRAKQVDEMTALEVVERYMPGGSGSVAGRSFHCYLAGFLGLDLAQLGGLAVVDNVAGEVKGADERYHVCGGNDQIVHGLAGELPDGSITVDAPLVSVVRRTNGSFVLRFDGVRGEVIADRVVFCLPFTALRRVDLDSAGLSVRKRRCIDELGMGTNAKVIMQFEHRPQQYGGWNGYLNTDRPVFQTWESSAGQPGSAGLITAYFGGRSGARGLPTNVTHGRAPAHTTRDVIQQIERGGQMGLPGLGHDFLGRSQIDHWSEDPWVRGSYAAYLPGQYTRFVWLVGKPEQQMFFAGEHASPLANQGYLEGAVRTGERAAREVLASLA